MTYGRVVLPRGHSMFETLMLAIGAATAGSIFVSMVLSKPWVGLVPVSVIIAASWEVPIWPPIFSALGFSISFPDLVCAALGVAGALMHRPPGPQSLPNRRVVGGLAVGVLVAALAFSAIRGVYEHSLTASLNEMRPWGYILLISFWAVRVLSSDSRAKSWFLNWILLTAAAVVLVGSFHALTLGLGGASTAVRSGTGELLEAGRPVSSGQAMVVAAAALVLLWRWRERMAQWYLGLGLVCITAVVLAQHRSVWIAMAAGLGILFLSSSGAYRIRLLYTSVAVIAAAVFFLTSASGTRIYGLLTDSASDRRTYDGRVFDWLILIESNVRSGLFSIIFGASSGSGWSRLRVDGLVINYIPHNWYVASFLRIGIVGSAAMLAIAIYCLRECLSSRGGTVMAPVFVLLLVYCWAYNLQWYLAPLLALCLWELLAVDDTDRDGKPESGANPGRMPARGEAAS